MSHVMMRTSALERTPLRLQTIRSRSSRTGAPNGGWAQLAKNLRAIVRTLLGVALALGGLAITGGSFGLFAFIGIPLMAVGLGMITCE